MKKEEEEEKEGNLRKEGKFIYRMEEAKFKKDSGSIRHFLSNFIDWSLRSGPVLKYFGSWRISSVHERTEQKWVRIGTSSWGWVESKTGKEVIVFQNISLLKKENIIKINTA